MPAYRLLCCVVQMARSNLLQIANGGRVGRVEMDEPCTQPVSVCVCLGVTRGERGGGAEGTGRVMQQQGVGAQGTGWVFRA